MAILNPINRQLFPFVTSTLPDVVKQLEEKLADESRRYVAANFPDGTPGADPEHFGGVYSPGWC